jgi:uncharacterized membrane protein
LKSILYHIGKATLAYLLFSIAFLLMLQTIVPHLSLGDKVGFLKEKQAYIHDPVWRTAFYIHVFSSIFTLLAGATQFSDYILKHHRKLHRIIGKIYVWDILFINFPTGMILALNANGGWHSSLAFIILDCLWFAFTLKAVLEIKRKNIIAHKQFMIRSYALTFSAITLRSWKIILSNTTHLDPAIIYMMDAWLGFVPNLLFAEWLIRTRFASRLSGKIKLDKI